MHSGLKSRKSKSSAAKSQPPTSAFHPHARTFNAMRGRMNSVRRSTNDDDDDDGIRSNNIELAPIMISQRSEDEADIFLDETDAELQRIKDKYDYKRHTQRSRALRFFATAATAVLLLSLSIFALVHSTRHNKGDNGNWKQKSSSSSSLRFPVHPSFDRVRSKYFPAYQASMHLYRHIKTEAEFIAYIPSDEKQDKTFGISFRTKPTSDNGVAHILEHSVLSGSKKYPCKDPFLSLMKGSLNTFLNAMTYNDRTVYPIASRNKKDYMNLMSVYLDAVFAPKCVEESGSWVLTQEGWRYDTEDGDGSTNNDDLVIKGVVYSEMKGVYSNPLSLLDRNTDKYLFQDNTYHYDSGGDPTAIPTLTQDEFSKFYHQHYHPTNSKIFVSGTVQDAMDSMILIDTYLQEYEFQPKMRKGSQIEFQKKNWNQHLYQTLQYPVQKIEEDQGQHMLLITWLLNDKHLPMKTELAFYVLDYLLVGAMSSPLNKRLMESGFGSNVIGNGLGTGLMQSTFAIGMRDVEETDIIPLEKLIIQILEDVVKDGFSDDDIEAAMNSIEFQLREVHTGSRPAGISMFLQMLTKWNYDLDPESAVDFENALQKLKKSVKSDGSDFFVKMIRKYLLTNNHRVHMELKPSETLEEETILEEKKKLRTFQSAQTPESLVAIKQKAEKLKQVQETDDKPEVLDSIPTLELSDVDRKGVEYDLLVLEDAYDSISSTVTKNVVSGSPGIVYIDIGIDISNLSYANVEMLPFILSMLTENDTTNNTRVELDRLEGMYTGGIGIDLKLIPLYSEDDLDYVATHNKRMRSMLFLRGKCTVDKTEKMLNLIKEMVETSLPVSQEKAIQIFERKISSIENSISSSGHAYSVKRMHARYDVQAFFEEKLNGISQLQALKALLYKAQNNWGDFEERISKVISSFSTLYAGETLINLTGDELALNAVDNKIRNFVSSLATDEDRPTLPDFYKTDHPWVAKAAKEMHTLSPIQDEGIPISSQVSYVGKGGLLYHEGEKVGGGSCAPLQFLKKGYLWDTVRAKNGAYGVMAALDNKDGSFYMVSYRDPQLSKTINAFDRAGNYLSNELAKDSIKSKDIKTAIIGCIGAIDGSALPPRQVGWTAFYRWLSGSSASRRQKWRDEILNTKKSDFKVFSERLMHWENSTVAAIAPNLALNSSGLDLVTVNL